MFPDPSTRGSRRGPEGTPAEKPWQVAAWLLTALFAAGVCYSLLRIPIQTTDAVIPLLDAQETPSVWHAIVDNVRSAAYLRPLRIAQIQALFQLADGRYFLAFKGFHVVLVACCFALFALILNPQSKGECAAFAVALTALTGLHTFLGTVWEAYPINHFLEIGVFCLAAFALGRSRPAWWKDLVASAILIVAAFTLESGLLVWVVACAGWMVGLRGISARGIAGMTVLLLAYLVLRFGFLPTGLPTLMERSSGFGTSRLEPEELIRRFGEWPYGFYAYNVVSSFASVLFSEPRAGVWEMVAALVEGRLVPAIVVNVVSSTLMTGAIVWYGIRRWHAWRTREFNRGDEVVLVGLAVLVANAAVSYGYTKDEIMSPAGMFYALAVFVAVAEALRAIAVPTAGVRTVVAVGSLLVALAGLWSMRAIGLHYRMHQMAFQVRNEWVTVYSWLEHQNEAPHSEQARQLVEQLRDEAIEAAVVNPRLLEPPGRQLIR